VGFERGWLLVLKTDAIIEGVHFNADTPPAKVGRKAIARCLSDMAAMAAEPREALVTLAIPPSTSAGWVRNFYRGASRIARQFATCLVGGETAASLNSIFVSVAMTGRVKKPGPITRSGGQPGDALLVTGQLGGSIRGHHLDFTPRISEARWLASNFTPHAMMDVSDGLASDLPRLARASGCGWSLDESRLPLSAGSTTREALCDGEDYELLLALPPEAATACLRKWPQVFPRVPLTMIGALTKQTRSTFKHAGYDHFKKPG
jgi:thiamine-monophosphate kinase